MTIRIHPTADVSAQATIGENTSIWHHAQIREGAVIGSQCVISKGVYIDADVSIGSNVKIQNYVSVYHGVTIEDGVFIGPHVCFTNDLMPRAVTPDGLPKTEEDWVLSKTTIKHGASLGANSTIRCGILIGEWAMIGSGSVVTKDIPPHGLVYGNPARLHGFVCSCGIKLEPVSEDGPNVRTSCPKCNRQTVIPSGDWRRLP